MGCSHSRIENEALLLLPLSDNAHQEFLLSDHSSSSSVPIAVSPTDSSDSAVISQFLPPPPSPYPFPQDRRDMPDINRRFDNSSAILPPPPPPPTLPLQRAVSMFDPPPANGLNRSIIEEYEISDDDDDDDKRVIDSEHEKMVSRLRLWGKSLAVTNCGDAHDYYVD